MYNLREQSVSIILFTQAYIIQRHKEKVKTATLSMLSSHHEAFIDAFIIK